MTTRSVPSWSRVRKLARDRFGVTEFRPGQRALVRAALEGRHALGVLPTGAGKSLTYQLPALLLPGVTVVVSPLLSLIQDQTEKLEDADVPAEKLDSTLTDREAREASSAVRDGEAALVYVTPERLERPETRAMLRERGVALLVVDEAHCVSQWGHDFRPAYLSIRDAHAALGSPPVLALTATATPEVAADVLAQLGVHDAQVIRSDTERTNLFFEVTRTPSEDAKEGALLAAVRETKGSCIVYAATTKAVDELEEMLASHDIPCVRYHGKMRVKDRQEAQRRFMGGEVDVVVAA
jgi:ATP-dependent DNA helicase RecQ